MLRGVHILVHMLRGVHILVHMLGAVVSGSATQLHMLGPVFCSTSGGRRWVAVTPP